MNQFKNHKKKFKFFLATLTLALISKGAAQYSFAMESKVLNNSSTQNLENDYLEDELQTLRIIEPRNIKSETLDALYSLEKGEFEFVSEFYASLCYLFNNDTDEKNMDVFDIFNNAISNPKVRVTLNDLFAKITYLSFGEKSGINVYDFDRIITYLDFDSVVKTFLASLKKCFANEANSNAKNSAIEHFEIELMDYFLNNLDTFVNMYRNMFSNTFKNIGYLDFIHVYAATKKRLNFKFNENSTANFKKFIKEVLKYVFIENSQSNKIMFYEHTSKFIPNLVENIAQKNPMNTLGYILKVNAITSRYREKFQLVCESVENLFFTIFVSLFLNIANDFSEEFIEKFFEVISDKNDSDMFEQSKHVNQGINLNKMNDEEIDDDEENSFDVSYVNKANDIKQNVINKKQPNKNTSVNSISDYNLKVEQTENFDQNSSDENNENISEENIDVDDGNNINYSHEFKAEPNFEE